MGVPNSPMPSEFVFHGMYFPPPLNHLSGRNKATQWQWNLRGKIYQAYSLASIYARLGIVLGVRLANRI